MKADISEIENSSIAVAPMAADQLEQSAALLVMSSEIAPQAKTSGPQMSPETIFMVKMSGMNILLSIQHL